MTRLFVDTSAWFALADGRDADHARVRRALADSARRIVTSNYVFDEAVTLCRSRLGHRAASDLGARLLDGSACQLARIEPADESAAWALFRARPDQDYSFTDCTSFVLMRRLRIDTAAALDDDFAREGFAVVPATYPSR